MSHHITEVSGLYYKYAEGSNALNGISFRIRHGESVAVAGVNGAGKSTLLMLLVGILFPQKGEVRIGDMLLTKKTLSEIRKKVGVLFQDPDDQLFMPTVYDDAAFGPRNNGLDEYEVKKKVEKALGAVNMTHLADRPPFRLSGGEKRSAAIASILSMSPDILLMDEPTAGLDPKARRRLIELLKGFTHTKIIATHDLDMAYELCDRVIIIKNGLIAADGIAQELLADPVLMEECGLELPLSLQGCPYCGSKK